MTVPAAAGDPREDGDAALGSWPPGVSRSATMRISDVLRDLQGEFPALTHSKLRFLEEQGLIEPVRTAAGYRQYSAADVERLRFVLAQQRDRYLPLKVIKEHLAALDAGEAVRTPVPRVVGEDDRTRPTVRTLAQVAGVDRALVDELVRAGVVQPGPSGELDTGSVEVVRVVASLGEFGIEPRHLRPMRAAVDRQVALVDQVVAPWRSQLSVTAQARADEIAAEVGELCARLHTALLRQGVADLTP